MTYSIYWRSYRLGLVSLFLSLAGCGWFSPPPAGPGSLADTRAPAMDPKVKSLVEGWEKWLLQIRETPEGQPLFSRVEILPMTVTTLPYGVGANQQQPRLPVILTTGSGWGALRPEQKEEQIARIYREIRNQVQKAGFGKECQPTLTLQTPQGLLLAWVNDISEGKKLIHGDSN